MHVQGPIVGYGKIAIFDHFIPEVIQDEAMDTAERHTQEFVCDLLTL